MFSVCSPISKEDKLKVMRAVFDAVRKVLQPLEDKRLSMQSRILICLEAFTEAKKVEKETRIALQQENGLRPEETYQDVEVTPVVCTALLSIASSISNLGPDSVHGLNMIALMKACKGIELLDTFKIEMTRSEDIWLHQAELAGQLMRKLSD